MKILLIVIFPFLLFAQYGQELITNGTFTTDLTGWQNVSWSTSRKSWWSYCDGLQIKFAADTTGGKSWEIRGTLKIK